MIVAFFAQFVTYKSVTLGRGRIVMNYFRYQEKTVIPEKFRKAVKPLKGRKLKMSHFTITKDFYAFRNEDGRTVGIMENTGRILMVGDKVEIKADGDGYIGPSIADEGIGKIVKFRINGDVRPVVQMNNGEYGPVTLDHVWKKF